MPGEAVAEAAARRLVVDPVEVNLDEALPAGADRRRGRRLADDPDEGAVLVALDAQDRMGDEARLVALVGELGEGRIEEERAVVVDDLDGRHLAPPALPLDLEVDEAQVRAVAGARGAQVPVGRGGEVGERLRRVGGEVLFGHAAVEQAREVPGHPGPCRRERPRLVEEVAPVLRPCLGLLPGLGLLLRLRGRRHGVLPDSSLARDPSPVIGGPDCSKLRRSLSTEETAMKAKERGKPEVGERPTPQETDGRVTALDLKPGELSPEMRAYFQKCDEKIGFVPNVLRAYAHDNAKLEAFAALYNDLMLAPSGLSKLEREMIAVVVSSCNRCYYCLTAHGAAVRQLSGDPVLGEMLVQNYRAAELSPRHRAMLDFAAKLAEAPFTVEETDREALRRAGFSDRDIWDVAAVTSFFAMSNRMASAVDMRPNREYHAQAR
jgi:uncharacterized peroxidase-related enzyme